MNVNFPANVGSWQRQVQGNPLQWVYKRNPRSMGQAPIDHITLQLDNAGNFTWDFHYTTQAAVPWNAQVKTVTINAAATALSDLVYVYDYVLNPRSNTVSRSNQVNHNEGRYPKRYTSPNTAAQAIFGAPQISADAVLRSSYRDTFQMRGVNAAVAEFWAAFPRIKIQISMGFWGEPAAFAPEVRDGGTVYTPARTDERAGVTHHYGHALNAVEVRVPGILAGWTRAVANQMYADAEPDGVVFT